MPSDNEPRAATGIWFAALATAVAARTIELGRWPGLNGDESWYGVNVLELLNGGTPFLQTGVGNPLNPLHSGVLLALSTIFTPSPALLRVPEVILGILTVAIGNPLLGRPLGRRAAFVAALLLALSPTAIAYSRLGWDPSGTPFVSLLAIGCALRDRPWLAMLAFAFAYLVHPTNVFLAPVVAAAWAPHALDRYRNSTPHGRQRLGAITIAGAILAIPIGIWAVIGIANNPETPLPSVSLVIERIISPALWLDRGWGVLGLLSGTTAVIDMAGPLPALAQHGATAIVAIALLFALVAGWKAFRHRRHAPWLLAGCLAAIAGFHIVALPDALDPGLERYALFLLVPLVLLTAIAIDALADTNMKRAVMLTWVVAATMLAVLLGGYFHPIATTGGASASTYRTGPVEPKLATFRFIEAHSRDAGAVTIIAEDWWLYWSLRYFAGPGGRIHVVPALSASIPGGTRPAGASEPAVRLPDRTYYVAFAVGETALRKSNAMFTAIDPLGRAIIEVVEWPLTRTVSGPRGPDPTTAPPRSASLGASGVQRQTQ